MKKFIYIFAWCFFLALGQANAQEIYVDNFTAPEGGIQKFDVKYKGVEGKTINGYIFKFRFPEGLSLAADDKDEDKVIYEYGEGNDGFDVKTTSTGIQASPKSKTAKLAGDEGTLLTLTLKVSDPLVQGNEVNVEVYDASLTEKVTNADATTSYKDFDTAPFTFTVTIIENRITLDENEGVTEDTPTGTQNVLVKRTIKANQWSTLVLPFAMTAEQMKEAFGDGVQLANFTGITATKDADDNVTDIKVNFEAVTEFEANHPYLIYVTSKIDEFKLDGVEVDPDEDGASVDCDKKGKGKNVTYNSFIGTYTPNTVLGDEEDPWLFLSNNMFYYSKGTAKMKAFRGYFSFYEYLADVVSDGSAKIGFSVDSDATSVDGLPAVQRIVEGVYDLSGRKIQVENGDVNTLQKGVYIIDGKKVTIK